METQTRNGANRENAPAQQGAQQAGTQPTRAPEGRRPMRGELMQDTGAGPFGSMLQLSREMDRLWDAFFGRRAGAMPSRLEGNVPSLWSPHIDVQHRDDAVLIHADLPGCRKEDVQIDATEEGIAISGHRTSQREEGEAGKNYHLNERSYGSFYRNIPLPEGANVDQAKANMSEGVLKITIPLQQPQRRRIQIE